MKYKNEILFNDKFSNLYNWTIFEKMAVEFSEILVNLEDIKLTILEKQMMNSIIDPKITVNQKLFYNLITVICKKEVVSVKKLTILYNLRNSQAHAGYESHNADVVNNYDANYEYESIFTKIYGGINEN